MFFGKKKKDEIKCESCGSKISTKFSFCPYCGLSMLDEREEIENFGLIGRNNAKERNEQLPENPFAALGVTDKIITSLMNSVMKNIGKSMKEPPIEFQGAEIKQLPNGISIKIGPSASSPQARAKQQKLSPNASPNSEQLKKLNKLPRASAKSSVKRLSDKIVYELNAPGVQSVNDVFISKLESGYEIKAIGEKRVYVNSIPVELPLRGFSIADNKLFLEFLTKSN